MELFSKYTFFFKTHNFKNIYYSKNNKTPPEGGSGYKNPVGLTLFLGFFFASKGEKNGEL